MALCEEENEHYRTDYVDSQGNLVEDQAQGTPPLTSRRQSFLQRIFGRTIPKGLLDEYNVGQNPINGEQVCHAQNPPLTEGESC
jgi:hypothetical protein